MTGHSRRPKPDGRNKIPGVVAEEIQRAFQQGACDLPVADRHELEQFFTSVLLYVQRWYSQLPEGTAPSGVVAFVLSRRPRTEVPPAVPEAEVVRYFASKPDRPLAGKVYFAAAGVKDARAWSSAGDEIESIAESIVSVGFGNNPAVLVDLATRQATLCRAGVDDEQSSTDYEIPIPTSELNVATVDEFLDKFHRAFLNPNEDQAIDIWASPEHGVPKSNVEKKIQIELLMAARLWFDPLCSSIPEVPTQAGRIDITIQPADSPVECGVLLELKALRSRASIKNAHLAKAAQFKRARKYSDKVNEEWVVDGIDQAYHYRAVVKAAFAFVCCFDLRLDNSPSLIEGCRSMADARNVELRHYPVFRGARQWRRSQPGSAHTEWKNKQDGGTAAGPSDGHEADE